jgi:Flp pilus assembly protein TadD
MIAKTPLKMRHLRNGAAATVLLVALSACAQLGFGEEPAAAVTSTKAAEADTKTAPQPVPAQAAADQPAATPNAAVAGLDASPEADLDGAIAQAQTARKNGNLRGAARILGQLVLFAPDDPRVLGEYGKTLVAEGRSDDALAFLERAIQLLPADWTLYSAQGVAYDQKTNYDQARIAYGRALALKPNEPAVLNNAALSRMQAGDLDGAERLLLEAEPRDAGDPRIAENLTLVRNLKATHGTPSTEALAASAAAAGTSPQMPAVLAAPLPPPPPSAPTLMPVPAQTAPALKPAAAAEKPAPVMADAAKPPAQPVVAKPAVPQKSAQAPKPTPAPASRTVASTAPAKSKIEVKTAPEAAPEKNPEDRPEDMKVASLEPRSNPVKPASVRSRGTSTYYVQAGAYSSEERADKIAASLDRLGARVSSAIVDGRAIFRVRIGPFLDVQQANVAIAEAQSLGYSDVTIVTE